MTPCIIAPNKPCPNGYVFVTVGGIGLRGRGHKGRGKRMLAHRAAWEAVHGPVPEGMKVLHLCDNPPCWNVEHLHLGTQKRNMEECKERGRNHVPQHKTHCKHGHEMTPENTYIYGNRHGCRACRAAASRRCAS